MATKIKLKPEQMKQFNYLMFDIGEAMENLQNAKTHASQISVESFNFPLFNFFNYTALSVSAAIKHLELTREALSGVFEVD